MKYTDQQLIKRVESHADGFDGWQKGVYDIWLRKTPTAAAMDTFDDKVYTFEVETEGGIPEFRMVCRGTSHAGSYGLKKFHEYNPAGCAVLKSNHFVRNSHVWGFHKGYRAYRQAKPFPYFRDNDYDNLIEEIGEAQNDIILANCHRAAQAGESVRIYNWSVACLVRSNANQWNAWMAFMDKRPLSTAILREF